MREGTVWERTLHQRVDPRTLAVAGDRLVVHERWSRLVCLDRRDGTVRWDVPFGLWPRSVVVAGDHVLGIAQDSDVLRCWDLATGVALWEAALRPFTGHITVGAGTVLVGGWRGYSPLHAFDLRTGHPLWSTSQRRDTVLPLAVGDYALVGADSGTCLCLLGMRDGVERARWELPEPLTPVDAGAAFSRAADDRVLVRCGPGTVVEVRVECGTVRTLRRHDTALMAAPVEYAGELLWLREPGGYAVVDPSDGSLRRRVDLRQRPAEGVVPTGSGFLVGGDQGTVLRLDPAGRVVARAAVSRRVCALRPAGPDGHPEHVVVATRGTLLALRL
ncbi:PQQ-binding-like beta-propeller repeat protein [Actinacidiphila glaucinigra]|uniref:outer membrane protein assembly factor BamB family protein n=1 Tax=Actinacidiphila glaucinigra TaxID=235986 RepID=UPI0037204461